MSSWYLLRGDSCGIECAMWFVIVNDNTLLLLKSVSKGCDKRPSDPLETWYECLIENFLKLRSS
jgi:hypothetical protein